MFQPQWKRILVYIFVAIIWLNLAWMVWLQDFLGKTCLKDPTNGHLVCEKLNLPMFILNFLNNYGSTITGLATVLLAVITYMLVSLSREQSKITKAQLRAYVFVSSAVIVAADIKGTVFTPTKLIDIGYKAATRFVFKNTGQTPAYDVQIFGRIDLVSWPLEEASFTPLPFGISQISRSTIGPGESTNKFEIFPESRGLNNVEIDKLRKGELALVIHGEVRYKDVFGDQRWTKYRYFNGGPVGINNDSLFAHQEGNSAN